MKRHGFRTCDGPPIAAILAFTLSCLASCGPDVTTEPPSRLVDAELAKELRGIIARRRVPAIAAARIERGGTIVQATVGRVAADRLREVDGTSRFHIGSITKSMTALLLGMLVAEGRLGWDTTLEEALPEIPMRTEYRSVTVHELLLNRAGVIAFQRTDLEKPEVVRKLWGEIPNASPDPVAQRRAVTELALALPPIAPPGTKSVYSNMGWAIAGHIAERAAGASYETLVRERIFAPLGMAASRVGGWPASKLEPGQPRGHYAPAWFLGRPRPQPIDDPYTFPSWMNASGGVSCTLADFARYALETLRGAGGEGILLDAAGYGRILSEQGEARLDELYLGAHGQGTVKLGYGWALATTKLGTAFAADGSGGTFYARVGILPQQGAAFVAVANSGNAEPAIGDAMKLLMGVAE